MAGSARYLPLKNGNFESGNRDDWKSYGLDEEQSVVVDKKQNVHLGSHALRLVKSEDQDHGGIYQTITPHAKPGDRIHASAWVRTEDAGGIELHLGITVKNAQGEVSGWGTDAAIPLSEDWKRIHVECKLPTHEEMPDFE